MRSRTIEAYKATLRLSPKQQEVLVGLLLGDGHLEHSPCTERARLRVEQRAGARRYVQWLHSHFREWVRGSIRTKSTFLQTTGTWYQKYCFWTYVHEAFIPWYQLFYRDRRKIIPKNIAELLTPLGLAVWFMDDGSVKSHESRGRILNTHDFTKEEVERLCYVLGEKFSLDAWPRRQRDGTQVYISGYSAPVLQSLLAPIVIPSMRYKLPLKSVRVNRSA